MILTATRTTTIIAALGVLAGCQSGPRWAWWKHDKAPDASVVARSAEPALPSAQTTPQAVAIAGLAPAAPPSSANLAAAGAATSPPNISIPVTSSATVTNAPLANYAAANSLADKLTSAPYPMTMPANMALPSATAPTPPAASMTAQQLATVPPAGPYDPKAYKPDALSAGTDSTGALSAGSDRYGLSTADRYSTPHPLSTSQPAASTPNDRYGVAQTMTAPASPAATKPLAAQSPATMPDRYASLTPTAVATQAQTSPVSPSPSASAATAPSTAISASNPIANSMAPLHLSAAPGQYRPGGTSSYTGLGVTPSIEVATRPSPASTTVPPAPSSAPSSASEPWAPSTSSATPPATRTY